MPAVHQAHQAFADQLPERTEELLDRSSYSCGCLEGSEALNNLLGSGDISGNGMALKERPDQASSP